jgi:lysophospholipase L1-like esterase
MRDADPALPADSDPRPTVPVRALRLLVWIIIGPPTAGALLLALFGEDPGFGLAILLVLVLAAALAAASSGRAWAGGLGLALCAVSLVPWAEVGLRIAGFRFDDAGVIVFGGELPPDTIRARRDAELFWTLPPGRDGVNAHGFLTREFVIPKPADTYRIVFLGDSCTQQGFPALVERSLAERAGNPRYESVNLGIAGYSSYQGRVVADRWARQLEPDVGVVFFGWNDHWLAWGFTDAERARLRNRLVADLLGRSRLFQGLVQLKRIEPAAPTPGRTRVSRQEYRANLEAIGEAIERAGGRALLVTAPSAHEQRGVPEQLVDDGLAESASAVIERHRAYNETVREVARERGFELLDLAQEAPKRVVPTFLKDGIHFTPLGLRWVAAQIADRVIRIRAAGTSAGSRESPARAALAQ